MEANYITYGHMKDIKDKYLRPLGHGETAPPTPPVSSLPFKSASSYPNRCSVKVSPPDVNQIMLLGELIIILCEQLRLSMLCRGFHASRSMRSIFKELP